SSRTLSKGHKDIERDLFSAPSRFQRSNERIIRASIATCCKAAGGRTLHADLLSVQSKLSAALRCLGTRDGTASLAAHLLAQSLVQSPPAAGSTASHLLAALD